MLSYQRDPLETKHYCYPIFSIKYRYNIPIVSQININKTKYDN